ncbi:MAG: Trm112 family protein [bacterium]|nr:Trm112 family protein [bacterium]
MSIDKELLEILVCPKCKGDLELTPEEDGFICRNCKLKYPIRDGIPVMLIEEAIKLKD